MHFLEMAAGETDNELPEVLVTAEKQTLSREVGEILSHSRSEEGGRENQGRRMLCFHLILSLTGSSFNGT